MLNEYTNSEVGSGLFMAGFFSPETNQQLAEYLRANNVPNPTAEDSFHVTIVNSIDPVDIEENHVVDILIPRDLNFIDCWNTPMGKTLVLRLFSPYLHFRFAESIAAGAHYNYPVYNPHITLSEDIGDWDYTHLIKPNFDIHLIGEYCTYHYQ